MDDVDLDGLGQDGTHDEGTEGGGEAGLGRQDHHAEAEADGEDEERLLAHVAPHPAQEGGYEVDAEEEPGDEEEGQLAHLPGQRPAVEGLADADGAQDDEEQHGDEVLDHKDGGHGRGELLLLELQVVEAFDDDAGGRDGEHAAQEGALHRTEAQDFAHRGADEEHDGQLGEGGDGARGAHLLQLLDAELQAQGEHEEDDADVAPDVYVGRVGHGGEPLEVGPDEETGQDVAQHQGLLEPLEDDRDDAGGDEDDSEVGEYCG